jgi:16S rRNA (uracil1498-N3)-methyltransferase
VPRAFDTHLLRPAPGPRCAVHAASRGAQHVGKALRLKAGDEITVFDGRGGEYGATIQRLDKDRVDVKVGAFRDASAEPRIAVGLVQGLPEADKMDWIIQKSVELGVAWIQPLCAIAAWCACRGSAPSAGKRTGAASPIAACEQCGRDRIPEVRPTLNFQSWIAAPSELAALDAHPRCRAARLDAGTHRAAGARGRTRGRAVGARARAGALPPLHALSLGPRVLRTETASLAALAAIHALWADFRP